MGGCRIFDTGDIPTALDKRKSIVLNERRTFYGGRHAGRKIGAKP